MSSFVDIWNCEVEREARRERDNVEVDVEEGCALWMTTGVLVFERWRVVGCNASRIGNESEIAVVRVKRGICDV